VIRAVVAGAAGRMGSRILAMLGEEKDFAVTGAFERPESELVGPEVAGIRIAGGIEAALEPGADVVIDFTAPAASLHHASVCAGRGVPLVIGTTGLSAEQKAELRALARRTPLLIAPNMSVGVNVLFRLVADAARALGPAYEVEIVELHHRMKRDAPSGTALRLAEVAAEALGLAAHDAVVYERRGEVGARKKGTIGVQALRGGDVVGEHTVHFLADGERLELTHEATSRDNFVRGAIRAARWIPGRKPGLYDMQDVLGWKT
jgi:4-hydroxy-tetrahydrodipicolinate reductase